MRQREAGTQDRFPFGNREQRECTDSQCAMAGFQITSGSIIRRVNGRLP